MAEENRKIGGITGWFRALAGKPKSKLSKETKTESPAGEDQVTEDIEEAKTLFQRVLAGLKKTTAPYVEKGKTSTKGIIDKDFLKKIIRIFFIILFLLILTFIGIRLVQMLQQEEAEQASGGQAPTTAPFSPVRPSVYAEDLEVLGLEQDINVLEREVSRVILREDSLFPPTLDFNVKFTN